VHIVLGTCIGPAWRPQHWAAYLLPAPHGREEREESPVLIQFVKFSLTIDLQQSEMFPCRWRHWWHVTTSSYLVKNIWPIYTNFVLSGRWQSLCKRCDSMANGSKFFMCETLCIFFWYILYMYENIVEITDSDSDSDSVIDWWNNAWY